MIFLMHEKYILTDHLVSSQNALKLFVSRKILKCNVRADSSLMHSGCVVVLCAFPYNGAHRNIAAWHQHTFLPATKCPGCDCRYVQRISLERRGEKTSPAETFHIVRIGGQMPCSALHCSHCSGQAFVPYVFFRDARGCTKNGIISVCPPCEARVLSAINSWMQQRWS